MGLLVSDLIDAANFCLDDGPFAVPYVSIGADLTQIAREVDLVGRIKPRFQLHRAQLVVERVNRP